MCSHHIGHVDDHINEININNLQCQCCNLYLVNNIDDKNNENELMCNCCKALDDNH